MWLIPKMSAAEGRPFFDDRHGICRPFSGVMDRTDGFQKASFSFLLAVYGFHGCGSSGTQMLLAGWGLGTYVLFGMPARFFSFGL
jgi:hypothetical protein